MELDDTYIMSEDGLYVLGKKNRTDKHGKPHPDGDMFRSRMSLAQMRNLDPGQNPDLTAANEARRVEYEVKIEKWLVALESGLGRARAAKKLHITYDRLSERMKTDPAFMERVRLAESVADEAVLDVVWKDIVENGNSQLGVKWLEKRNPDWRDKREVVQTNVARLEIDTSDRVAGIMKMLESLQERKALAEGVVIDVESKELSSKKTRNTA